MAVRSHPIAVNCTGAAGAATGSATVGVPPVKLLGIHIAWAATQAVPTADVTISNLDRDLLTITDSTTDALYAVRENVTAPNAAAAPAGDNRWAEALLSGVVTVTVAQADPDPAPDTPMLTVTLLYEAE